MILALLAILGAHAEHQAIVLDCNDGDTCHVILHDGRGSWSEERIRLCDVYAPESNEPGHEAAHRMLRQFAMEHRIITVRIPHTRTGRERKSFDRIMGWLITPRGVVINQVMVKSGLARLPMGSEPRCPAADTPNAIPNVVRD